MKETTPDIQQILADLQAPDAYPHPVHQIHAVQTHGACVFLTGEIAYKVKKPVDFGFLDYSTLERRRHFCEQELRLNRRLCPDIYLNVLPLTLNGGRLRVGGEGEPVEWAIQMRQLREEEMLSVRLAARAVSEADIERIARMLANFHTRARQDETLNAFGAPESVAQVTRNTLDTMDRLADGVLPDSLRQDIRAWFEAFHTQKDRFNQRMEDGWIRDCHGDLRAQNICLDARYDAGIQVFDCIEFNDEFRYIDTAADIAYLAMDLDLAGRADLRAFLIETYLRAAHDAGLPSVLNYYQIYRAVVRGNIALLAAREQELGEAERQVQRDLALSAYDLAWSSARRRKRPALIITVGLSGSGKSALAQELSRRMPAVLLSSDHVRKELAGVPESAVLDSSHYSAEQRNAVYAELYSRARAALRQGEHVVLDATFLYTKDREETANLAADCGAEFWILDCRCSDSVIRERLRKRSQSPNASDADIAVYEGQLRTYQSVQSPLPGGWHFVVVNLEKPSAQAAHETLVSFVSAT